MAAATARQPSRTVGYFGTHAHSSRSLRFAIRKLLANISPSEPKRYFIHGGASFGAGTPSVSAREPTNSRRRMGSSSETLLVPASDSSAAMEEVLGT